VLARHSAHDASEAAAHGAARVASGLSDSLSSGSAHPGVLSTQPALSVAGSLPRAGASVACLPPHRNPASPAPKCSRQHPNAAADFGKPLHYSRPSRPVPPVTQIGNAI
jgi:hypothetical protein